MNDFLDVATQLHRTDRVGRARADYDVLFAAVGALQRVHSKARLNIHNIESVFAAFEFAKIVRSFCDYPRDQIDGLANAARSFITQTIEETMRFPIQAGRVVPPAPYQEFFELVARMSQAARPAHDVVVITFNYDFAADFALTRLPFGIDYGFSEVRRHAEAVPLLKLHGSVSWSMCAKCRKIRPFTLKEYLEKNKLYPGDEVLRFDFGRRFQDESCCGEQLRPQPVIVPPTWNKSSYHEVLSAVWATAARELSEADNIFVAGYSLPETDVFF